MASTEEEVEHGVEAGEELGGKIEACGIERIVVDEAAARGVDAIGGGSFGVDVGGGEWPAASGNFAGKIMAGLNVLPELLDFFGAGEEGTDSDDRDLA